MCLRHCKRYFKAKDSQPIHPVWLELSDKELQREFDLKQSKTTIRYLRVCSIIMWCAILLKALLANKEILQDLENVFFGISLAFNFSVMAVVCKRCPKLTKYFMLQMFVFRSISIYVMFYFIELKGDQKYADKK